MQYRNTMVVKKIIIFFLFFFFLTLLLNCSIDKKKKSKAIGRDGVIIYHVFDSLENLLYNYIEVPRKDTVVGIIIDPLAGDLSPSYKEFNASANLFRISILRHWPGGRLDSIIKYSNRKMIIPLRTHSSYMKQPL